MDCAAPRTVPASSKESELFFFASLHTSMHIRHHTYLWFLGHLVEMHPRSLSSFIPKTVREPSTKILLQVGCTGSLTPTLSSSHYSSFMPFLLPFACEFFLAFFHNFFFTFFHQFFLTYLALLPFFLTMLPLFLIFRQ